MKTILAFLFILVCASLRAQAPVIDYLQVDEAKSQLWVIGKFGVDSGSVAIEDTTLRIVSWSDTMIVCGLPDSGIGAAGVVRVIVPNGKSNDRILSLIHLNIFLERDAMDFHTGWTGLNGYYWDCAFRIDLNTRPHQLSQRLPFEASKASHGVNQTRSFDKLLWTDSSSLKDSTVSVSGTVDLTTNEIIVRENFMGCVDMQYNLNNVAEGLEQRLLFTKAGIIKEKIDTAFSSYDNHSIRSIQSTSGKILFPPSTLNIVSGRYGQLMGGPVIASILVNKGDHTIVIENFDPIEEGTVALFAIDGRLLRKAIIDMETPGSYKFDARGIDHQIGLLVFQTKNGCIAKKILF